MFFCHKIFVLIHVLVSTGITIGFDPASLQAIETSGKVIFTITVLQGQLERSATVTFTTADGTASGNA